MAEHFYGPAQTIHFSNGACEVLLRAWIAVGERQPPADDLAAVLGFLRQRLSRGYGGRAFALNPPPAELAPPARLAGLTRIMALFIADLSSEHPDPALADIPWDRRLRLSWLARLLDLHAIVISLLPPEMAAEQTIALQLPPADRQLCEVERQINRVADRRRADAETVLASIAAVLAAAERVEIPEERDRLLATWHGRRAEALLDQNRFAEALAALRLAAAHQRDPEQRQATEGYAAALADLMAEGDDPAATG